jgi:hypothetical protein
MGTAIHDVGAYRELASGAPLDGFFPAYRNTAR